MSDTKAVFRTLVDANNEGLGIRSIQQGDTTSTKDGLLGFSFRDSDLNAVLPVLNPDGTIAVSLGAAGVTLTNRNENLTGSLTSVAIATITLTASKKYSEITANMSCLRDTLFQLVWDNNGTPTVLDDVLLGAGQFTMPMKLDEYIFTAGATGTQTLKIMGKNLDKVSAMRARVSAKELA